MDQMMSEQMMSDQMMLEVDHLCTSFPTLEGEVQVVRDVSLKVPRGKIVGIVGESGCGKSMVVRSVMGLLKEPGRVVSGRILLDGRELTKLSRGELISLRGDEMSMVFQDPMTSLNPVVKVGKQVEEALRLHRKISHAEAKEQTIAMFEKVGMSEPASRYESYPHQLSGGLRQRVMIAMAMICRPKLLMADEPTTALDVTVEVQILRLMKSLCQDGTSVLLISHNLGVIAQVCDECYVMYAGQVVEAADIFTLFDHPLHPYTRGLLSSVSSLRSKEGVLRTIPGVVPNLSHLPEGCSFSPRCESCKEACCQAGPDLVEAEPGHLVRCLYWKEGEGR